MADLKRQNEVFPDSEAARRTQLCAEWIFAQKPRLLAYIRKCADDGTDAELLLAETARKVAAVFCKRDMSRQELIHYTLRSLLNNVRTQHRKAKVRQQAEEKFSREQAEYLSQRQDEAGDDEVLLMALREALERMPARHAAIMKMRLWENHTFARIAQGLGMSESSARRCYEAALEEAKTIIFSSPHE